VTSAYFCPPPPVVPAARPPLSATSTGQELARSPSGLTFAEPTRPRSNKETPTTGGEQPACVQHFERKMEDREKNRRRRRSSSLMYQEPPESLEQQSDQATMPNLNSQWVNSKGGCLPSPCMITARLTRQWCA